jgi:DNA invertase Pin-like site-specific DNA recombinase
MPNKQLNRSEIIALGDNKPFTSAAKEVGIAPRSFVSLYRTMGGERKGCIERKPPGRRELVEALKAKTKREVAEHYEIGYKTLIKWIKNYKIRDQIFTPDMMSLARAARMLKVSRMTLSNWYREGKVPGAVKINDTRVMVPKATVNMLLLINKKKELGDT